MAKLKSHLLREFIPPKDHRVLQLKPIGPETALLLSRSIATGGYWLTQIATESSPAPEVAALWDGHLQNTPTLFRTAQGFGLYTLEGLRLWDSVGSTPTYIPIAPQDRDLYVYDACWITGTHSLVATFSGHNDSICVRYGILNVSDSRTTWDVPLQLLGAAVLPPTAPQVHAIYIADVCSRDGYIFLLALGGSHNIAKWGIDFAFIVKMDPHGRVLAAQPAPRQFGRFSSDATKLLFIADRRRLSLYDLSTDSVDQLTLTPARDLGHNFLARDIKYDLLGDRLWLWHDRTINLCGLGSDLSPSPSAPRRIPKESILREQALFELDREWKTMLSRPFDLASAGWFMLQSRLELRGLYDLFCAADPSASRQAFYSLGRVVEFMIANPLLAKYDPLTSVHLSATFTYILFSDSPPLIQSLASLSNPAFDRLLAQSDAATSLRRVEQLLLRRDNDAALALLTALSDKARIYPNLSWILPEIESCFAILERYTARLFASIQQHLTWHKKRHRNLLWQIKDLLSIHACRYIKLATLLGLNIRFEHPLIPQEAMQFSPLPKYYEDLKSWLEPPATADNCT